MSRGAGLVPGARRQYLGLLLGSRQEQHLRWRARRSAVVCVLLSFWRPAILPLAPVSHPNLGYPGSTSLELGDCWPAELALLGQRLSWQPGPHLVSGSRRLRPVKSVAAADLAGRSAADPTRVPAVECSLVPATANRWKLIERLLARLPASTIAPRSALLDDRWRPALSGAGCKQAGQGRLSHPWPFTQHGQGRPTSTMRLPQAAGDLIAVFDGRSVGDCSQQNFCGAA